jgi:hypothetical protein
MRWLALCWRPLDVDVGACALGPNSVASLDLMKIEAVVAKAM